MDEIMAELLANAEALGVWLFGPNGDVIAGAVKDSSVKTPKKVSITGVTQLDFGDRHIYAEPLGSKALVFVFDHQPSIGLIRLGVRRAENAIEEALYRGFSVRGPLRVASAWLRASDR